MKESKLYIPIGAPACGKSTLGANLAEAFPDILVVNPDSYREMLTGDITCQDENGAVFSICHKITALRLSYDQSVYFDATNCTESRVKQLVDLASPRNEVVLIPFATSLLDCLDRNQERARVVPGTVVERMWHQSQELIDRLDTVFLRSPANVSIVSPESLSSVAATVR